MTKQTYETRSGLTQFRPVMTEPEYLHQQNECIGFCLACGETTDSGVEPDARKYRCESCGQSKVYGLQELLLMNLVVLSDEPSSLEVLS
jgi:hypothetical protein